MEGGDKGLCPGGSPFPGHRRESLSDQHFLPMPTPFLPMPRLSLELEDSRAESHPVSSSVPSEVLLHACKLELGLGVKAAEARIRIQNVGPWG